MDLPFRNDWGLTVWSTGWRTGHGTDVLPPEYVDVNHTLDSESTNDDIAHSAPLERKMTVQALNPHEQLSGLSPVGLAGSPRRKSNGAASTASRTTLSGGSGQFVLDLGPIEASTTLEFILYRDIREDKSQKDKSSVTELGLASAIGHPTNSDSSLDALSPFSSPMAHSSLAQLDLYDTRARNRVSATRCRIKQKASIARLKEAERIMMDERERLLELKKLLTDQVCGLKELLFMHAKCKEDRLIGEYMQLTATRIVENACGAAGQTGTCGQASHLHPGPHSPEELDNDSDEE